MPTCVACDTALLPGRPFCGGCGARVAASPVPATPPASAPVCRCGAPVTGAFCGHCGTPREAAPVPEPEPRAEPVAEPVDRTMPRPAPAPVPVPTPEPTPEPVVRETPLTPPDPTQRHYVYSRLGLESGPVTEAELRRIAAADRLPPTTQVRDTEGGAWFALSELVRTTSRKSFGATLAFTFFLGALGAHWFYLGRPGLGLLRLVTWGATMTGGLVAIEQASTASYDPYTGIYSSGLDGGLLGAVWIGCVVVGLWTLLDLILVATRSVRDGEGRKLE